MPLRKILIGLTVLFLHIGTATGQEVLRIAAVVNDEIISVYDLESRIRLVMISTGVADNDRNRRRVAPEVLRALIDERLRLQEAKRHNISVSQREERMALQRLEKANRLPSGGLEPFMKRQGVDIATLKSQIQSSLSWTKYIRRRYQRSVHVSEEEIEEVLQRLRAGQGQEEFRLSEIFMAVDSPGEEGQVRANAVELVSQLRDGARFAAVARQFSQSATAAVGGDLGWMPRSAMPPHLSKIAPTLPLRKVSGPVRSGSGFHILYLHERRRSAGSDPRHTKVTLAQLFIPVSADNKALRTARQADIEKLRASLSGCKTLAPAARRIRSARARQLGKFVLADLAPSIRDTIKNLPVGSPSAPVDADGGILVFMVCERDQPAFRLPPRARIREQLAGRRLERVARRVLRDIRRAAIVDIRI